MRSAFQQDVSSHGDVVVGAIELVAEIDERHQIHADMPQDVPPGLVQVILLFPEKNEAPETEPHAAARE